MGKYVKAKSLPFPGFRLLWRGAIAGLLLGLGSGAIAQAQGGNYYCFWTDSSGITHDLGSLCGGNDAARQLPPPPGSSPSAPRASVGSGPSISLSWGTTDDLDLAVIEPGGSRVSWGSPTSASGGTLSEDVNSLCSNPTTNPVETVSWPAGRAPSGNYQVLVTYAIPCSNNNAPVPFRVTANVGGGQQVFESTLMEPGASEIFIITVP